MADLSQQSDEALNFDLDRSMMWVSHAPFDAGMDSE